jgi:hypothetical protein
MVGGPGHSDISSGMNAVPPTREGRGLSLLAAHCTSLEPSSRSARERLDDAVGSELAHKLLFALCAGHERHAA